MKFATYLKRDPFVDRDSISDGAASRLERELAKGTTLAALAALGPEVVGSMTAAQLASVVESHRRFQLWRPAAVDVGRRLESIEREVVGRTTSVHQLRALERAVKLCEAVRVDAVSRGLVLSTCLEAWDSCVAEMRRHGSVRCAAARLDEPGLAGYDDYVGRSFELASLRSYRWLAMRRGERERLLALALEPGSAALLDQVRLRKGRLGKAALGRSDESLLEELVGNDLEAAIVSDLDSWARIEALRSAANAYAGLLGTRPLRVSRLASVFLGDPGQPVGVAVLDGEGALVDWLELDAAEHGWLDRAADLVRTSEVRHVAVPSDTRSSKRLSSLEEKMGHGMAFVPVRPVALTEGRGALPEAQRTLPRTVQNAAVLAQRAMSPLEAWGGIDPVRAGVGEYQGELDEAELREILEAARAEVARAAARAPAPPLVVAPAPKALGTLVRTVAELRQGMMVSGTISNITGFGAFVSLGLEYEGMIHVSELSDRFVSDPTEVVQIGQKVTARVVEVDASRRRIALSLRSENERRPARTGAGKRSQVLRDLDKLFKKP